MYPTRTSSRSGRALMHVADLETRPRITELDQNEQEIECEERHVSSSLEKADIDETMTRILDELSHIYHNLSEASESNQEKHHSLSQHDLSPHSRTSLLHLSLQLLQLNSQQLSLISSYASTLSSSLVAPLNPSEVVCAPLQFPKTISEHPEDRAVLPACADNTLNLNVAATLPETNLRLDQLPASAQLSALAIAARSAYYARLRQNALAMAIKQGPTAPGTTSPSDNQTIAHLLPHHRHVGTRVRIPPELAAAAANAATQYFMREAQHQARQTNNPASEPITHQSQAYAGATMTTKPQTLEPTKHTPEPALQYNVRTDSLRHQRQTQSASDTHDTSGICSIFTGLFRMFKCGSQV